MLPIVVVSAHGFGWVVCSIAAAGKQNQAEELQNGGHECRDAQEQSRNYQPPIWIIAKHHKLKTGNRGKRASTQARSLCFIDSIH
jgi:hypothetical protein